MEISAPPYPKQNCNPLNLFDNLCDFRQWVSDHYEWLQLMYTELGIPKDNLPKLVAAPTSRQRELFPNMSVTCMFHDWALMRTFREKFDALVRENETDEDWESKSCVAARVRLMSNATLFVSQVFLDYEKREAKAEDMINREKEHLRKMLLSSMGEDFKDLFKSDGSDKKDTDIYGIEDDD